jgi:hypothetical protein
MTLANFLSLVTTLAIVAAGVFAGIQVRQFNKQRARESGWQLLHSFQTPEFVSALNIVFDLPEGLSKNDLEHRLGSELTSILVMFGTFESLGILVFRREIDIKLAEDFWSGVIILAARKFRRYLAEMRESSNRGTYYEWFQWLFEQLEKRESKAPAVPAFIAFRDWKP